jgi:hypothetical protein
MESQLGTSLGGVACTFSCHDTTQCDLPFPSPSSFAVAFLAMLSSGITGGISSQISMFKDGNLLLTRTRARHHAFDLVCALRRGCQVRAQSMLDQERTVELVLERSGRPAAVRALRLRLPVRAKFAAAALAAAGLALTMRAKVTAAALPAARFDLIVHAIASPAHAAPLLLFAMRANSRPPALDALLLLLSMRAKRRSAARAAACHRLPVRAKRHSAARAAPRLLFSMFTRHVTQAAQRGERSAGRIGWSDLLIALEASFSPEGTVGSR